MRIDVGATALLHHPAGLKTRPWQFSDFTFPKSNRILGLALTEVTVFACTGDAATRGLRRHGHRWRYYRPSG